VSRVVSDDRIKIWYLITSLDIGGTERTLIDLVSGLDRDRFAPTIWTITEPGSLADDVPADVPVHSLGATSKRDVRAPIRFLRAVHREKPDIIQSFLYFDNLLASIAGVISSETAVITGVREVPNELPLHRDITSRLKIYCSDLIISNSKAGRQYAIERGADSERVSVIWNGRDVNKYASGEASPQLYETLGLDDEAPVIGTVGRLVERKGHYDLLEAWPGILEEKPNAILLLVGDGPEREGLQRRAKELDCSDSVIFTGERDDVPDLLDLMDVFVFPSHYEGLPGALIEAMVAGLPIIATPVNGNSELIEGEKTGLFVPPQSAEAISERVLELLNDCNLKEELGCEAARYARREFTVDQVCDEFQNIYDSFYEKEN
jgi:glycosyltransferase involved in cell wall biosynthesis